MVFSVPVLNDGPVWDDLQFEKQYKICFQHLIAQLSLTKFSTLLSHF